MGRLNQASFKLFDILRIFFLRSTKLGKYVTMKLKRHTLYDLAYLLTRKSCRRRLSMSGTLRVFENGVKFG
jgi:hypothetical protein